MDLFRTCPRCAEQNDARFYACQQCGASLFRAQLMTLVGGVPTAILPQSPAPPAPKAAQPAQTPALAPQAAAAPSAPLPQPAPAAPPPASATPDPPQPVTAPSPQPAPAGTAPGSPPQVFVPVAAPQPQPAPAAAAPTPRQRPRKVRICPACGEANDASRYACLRCKTSLFSVPLSTAGQPRRARAPAPPAPKPPARRRRQVAPGQLACPWCGVAMEEGTAGMDNSLLQKVMLGVSWLELFFRPGGVSRPVSFLHPLEERTAAFCASCGGLWLDADRPKP